MATAAPARPNKYVYTRPWMYEKQRIAIFNPARIAVVEASTKAGKTLACLAWINEAAWRSSAGRNFWWVAPIYSQARIAFDRLRRALPDGTFTANKSSMTITLVNGAIIWFKSADNPDSLYGEDVWGAVVDEATRCAEEAWIALRTTLTATRGPVRIIGNVKGRKNWAYRLARRAEQDTTGRMHYAKITAYDAVQAGVLSAREIEEAKQEMPEDWWRELYMAEPSEDEGNPFGIQHIEACIVPGMSQKAPIVWGWDLGKRQDWTVGTGLDEDGDVCRFERFQMPWETTFERIVATTGTTLALVDSTGVGDPMVERLQRKGGSFQGYWFTAKSKQQLMEGLAVEIQGHSVHFPYDFPGQPAGVLVNELKNFEFEYTKLGVRYNAPEGLHDDCVCSLALARQARRTNAFGWDMAMKSMTPDCASCGKSVYDPYGGEERDMKCPHCGQRVYLEEMEGQLAAT